jgi:hypothetical protein
MWTLLPQPTYWKKNIKEQLVGISHANDVVDAVHRLAAASKQAGGITFTDKDGNIIIDNDDKEEENVTKEEPRPVANSNN